MLLLLLALAHAATLVRDVRVVDARGDQGVHDVLLDGGRIAAFDPTDPPADARVIDGGGRTMVPGLIDTHVHISMAPGGAWREEPDDARTARRRQHLRAYLAWGVTTLLDPAILPDDAAEIFALAAEGPAPRVLVLGPTFSPTGGYVTAAVPTFPSVGTPDEARALFDSFADLHPAGVKVTMEDGPLGTIWPLHSPEVREAITSEAADRGLDVYVHAMDPKNTRAALAMHPHALVHAPLRGGRRLAREVAAAGVFVSPTLVITEALLTPTHPEWTTDPRAVATVPADELATAADPAIQLAFARTATALLAPGLPHWAQEQAARAALRPGLVTRKLRKAIATTRRLHEAGVPLVLGSDAGNWPIIPYLFHGPSTHRELALMAQVQSPIELLEAATRAPAAMLGLGDELGTVEVGKRADLLIVDGDPLQDAAALSALVWVIRDGEARTPDGWMAE